MVQQRDTPVGTNTAPANPQENLIIWKSFLLKYGGRVLIVLWAFSSASDGAVGRTMPQQSANMDTHNGSGEPEERFPNCVFEVCYIWGSSSDGFLGFLSVSEGVISTRF